MNSITKPLKDSRDKISHLLSKTAASKFSRKQWLAVALVAVPVTIGGVMTMHFVGSLPPAELDKGLVIHDRSGKIVCTIVNESRIAETVPLDKISPFLKKAVLAAEDGNFYRHRGVDVFGIARAMFADLSSGRVVQGGSTITQQLAKNLYFENRPRTIPQKLRETILAVRLEEKYPKDKIFAAYLNSIYFGQGAYGVERAAKTYFGKPAAKLNLAESSAIAAMITSPSVFSQPSKRKALVERQQQILKEMVADKTVSKEEADKAKTTPLKFKSFQASTPAYMSFLDCVTDELAIRMKDRSPWSGNFQVYTTLDQEAQRLAQQELTAGIRRAPSGVTQGALVSLSVDDGSIVALVGGGGRKNSEFNRATAPHTTGSAFKPFVYLAALEEHAIAPDSVVLDAPFESAGPASYDPANFDGRYMGWMTIRRALALSRNTCAVRVLDMVGARSVAETAARVGISSRMDASPSLALGTCAASPLEMASAYATLVRGGSYQEPSLITHVEDANGKTIYQHDPKVKKVIDSESAYQMVDVLQDVVEKGTGTRAKLFDRPVGGKTGTSDGARDLWFVGFTPDTVTAVWMGNDHNKPIPGMRTTGGTVAAGVWKSYMQKYYKTHPTPAGNFTAPQNPLMDDPAPLHFFPEPSYLLVEAGDFITEIIGGERHSSGARDLSSHVSDGGRGLRRSSEMGYERSVSSVERDIDEHLDKELKRPGPIKRFFKKLKNWF